MTYQEFTDSFLPKFREIKSFRGKIAYAGQFLQRIGSGSGRAVFDIDGARVLKVAKNAKGIAQNEAEENSARYGDYDDILTKIFESADDSSWLIVEKAKKITESRFRQITGHKLYDVYRYVINFYYGNQGKRELFTIEPEIKEELDNDEEFTQRLTNFIADYSQSAGDMGRISTYGEVIRNGIPAVVLTDYGLSDEVYNTHYSWDRKPQRMYELYNCGDGNDDILSDEGNGSDVIRRNFWALIPDGVGDGDEPIDEEFIKYVLGRNKYPKTPISKLSFLTDKFHECVNNLKETLNVVENKQQFYDNLLELQNYLIEQHYYDREPLSKEEYVIDENADVPEVQSDTLKDKAYALSLATQITQKLQLPAPTKALGGGANGFAFELNQEWVLKLTADVSEADAASKIMRKKDVKFLAKVYKLYKVVDTEKNLAFFAILQENIQEKPVENFRKYDADIEAIKPQGLGYADVLTNIRRPNKFNYDEMVEWAKHILTDNPQANVSEPDRQAAYNFMIGIFNIRRELIELQIKSTDYVTIANLGYKDGVLKFFDNGGYIAPEPEMTNNDIVYIPEEEIKENVINEVYDKNVADVIANQIANKIGAMQLTYLNAGTFGCAYDLGDGRVLKITKDKSEAMENVDLKGKPLKYIAEPYMVFEVKSKNNDIPETFAIVLEKLNTNDQAKFIALKDKLNFAFEKIMGVEYPDVIDHFVHGYQYDDGVDENKIKNYMRRNSEDAKFFNSIIRIGMECKKYGVESMDYLNPENLGYKKDGSIGFFDVGFGNYFAKSQNQPQPIEVNEDGSALYSTTEFIGQDGFPPYNQNDSSPSIENNLDANSSLYEDLNYHHVDDATKDEFRVDERDMSFMKNSSTVDVKKKCRLAGNGNTSVACNQGDIKNFDIKSLNEAVTVNLPSGEIQTITWVDIKNDGLNVGTIEISLSKNKKYLILHKIYIAKPFRGEGFANDAMRLLFNYADKLNKIIVLTPDNIWGSNVSKLKKWYKSLGFVENKGKNKDFETRELMYRLPKGNVLGESVENKPILIKIDDIFYHQTNRNAADSILKNGFQVFMGYGQARFTYGIYFLKHPNASYGDVTLESRVSGNFIDFTNDELGDKWIELRDSYKWNNYEDLTSILQKDYPDADGIVFDNKYMIVVWYPQKSITDTKEFNKNVTEELDMNVLNRGVDKDSMIQVKDFPIKNLTVSKRGMAGAIMDIRQGRPSQTNEPVLVFYNIDKQTFLVEDGYHRVAQAYLNKEKTVPVQIYSDRWSDYVANISPENKFIMSEEIDASEAYTEKGALNTIIIGKRDMGLMAFGLSDPEMKKTAIENGLKLIPIKQSGHDVDMNIVYRDNPNGIARAKRILEIMKSHGGYVKDESTEEAREIGKLLGYSENSINDYVMRKYRKIPTHFRNIAENEQEGEIDFTKDALLNTFLNKLNKKSPLLKSPWIAGDLIYGDKGTLHFSRFDKKDRNEIELQDILAYERKKGIGSSMMQDIIDVADEMGTKLTLTAKPFGNEWERIDLFSLINFYKKFGFQPDLSIFDGEFKTEEEYLDYLREYPDEGMDMFRNPKSTSMLKEQIMSSQDLPFKDEIKKRGGKIYSVGGAVRDEFLGKESKDLDILITGVPMDELEQILSKYGRVDAVGKSFGILKFKYNGSTEDIDIAIPRTERPTGDGGHKGFDVNSDHSLPIEKDLERRDFTINAIAKDLNGGIVDPFNGQQDLKDKTIRVVNPQAFSDDPLRMLRAVQFASRFGFNIEPQTMQMIHDNAQRIKEIPPERILTEFDKIVKKGNAFTGAFLLKRTGLTKEIFGNDAGLYINKNAWNNVKTMGEFIWLLSHHLVENPADFYLKNLKGDVDTYKEIKALMMAFEDSEETDMIKARTIAHNMFLTSPKSLNSNILPNAIKAAAQELLSGKYPKSIADLQVNGNDLMQLGMQGKVIGDTLKSFLMRIYSNKVRNNRDELLSLAGKKDDMVNEAKKERIEYGCLMLYLDVPVWSKITSVINKDDIYDVEGYGIENEPHTTILYGFHEQVGADNVFDLIKQYYDLSPIKIGITGISTFENKDFDVVKMDVDSDKLVQLNNLMKTLPNTSDFPNYHPHVTLAYVKKGTGQKYIRKFEKLRMLEGDKLVFTWKGHKGLEGGRVLMLNKGKNE